MMDHTEAVRLHAVEKYVLGELPPSQRDDFEAHYFDCTECLGDLKAAAAFIDGSRQILREEARERVRGKSPSRVSAGWFAWVRPALAVPAFAALLLAIVVYQNAVTIPSLKQQSARAVPAEIVKSFYLPASASRGQNSLTVRVRSGEDFGLDVDLPPDNSSLGYLCQIRDQAGRVLLALPVTSEQSRSSVHLHIRGGALPAGKYDLVVLSGASGAAPESPRKEVARTAFAVEFLP